MQVVFLLKVALGLTVTAIALAIFSFIGRFGVLSAAGLILCSSALGVCVMRAKRELFEVRMLQAQIYLYHKDRAHQTCGSMDPHLTQAR